MFRISLAALLSSLATLDVMVLKLVGKALQGEVVPRQGLPDRMS
jgi:hypothetical protein